MNIVDYGAIGFDLGPMTAEIQAIPLADWVFRSDPESYRTRVVREGAPAFPVDAEAIALKSGDKVFGPGYVNRVVLSCVPAGEEILPHSDDFGEAVRSSSHHCHIPIITHPAAVMGFPDDDMVKHLARGRLYAMDETAQHYVKNPSKIDRVHLLFAYFPHAGKGL